MSEYALIAITAILSSNIVAMFGVGAVGLQSEKRSFKFMVVTSLMTVLSIVVSGMVYCLLEKYVLVKFELEYLKTFIVVCLSYSCAFISKSIIKLISKEQYYLYEKSYSLPAQVAVVVGALIIIEFKSDLLMSLYSLAMYGVGYLLVQFIFYGLYEKLDNNYVLKPARNVPVMLIALSFVSMVLYSVAMFF